MKHGGLAPRWEPSDGWLLYDQGGHPYLIARAFNKHTLGKDTSLGAPACCTTVYSTL